MSEGDVFTITLEWVKGYKFRVKFDLDNVAELLMDEPTPVGEGSGPNATGVLSAAVGNCLSASLLFCTRKAKINLKQLRTIAITSVARNEEGYWRVKEIQVKIFPEFDETNNTKVQRCLEILEKYCVVTQSVRNGIRITVEVQPNFLPTAKAL